MLNVMKKLTIGVALSLAGTALPAQADTIYLTKDYNFEAAMDALKAGKLEKAVSHLEQAASADIGPERLLPVLNNLCAIEYALGDLDDAEAACDRAIDTDRHYWRAYVNRGNVRLAKGEIEAAHSDYARALKLNPKGDLPTKAMAQFLEAKPKLMAEANK